MTRAASLPELPVEAPTLAATLHQIVELAAMHSPTDSASIVLWNADIERFDLSASTDPSQPADTAARRVRSEGGATRWIVDNGEPMYVPDVDRDPFEPNPMLAEYGYRAYAGVPIAANGKVLGVLFSLDKRPRGYLPEQRLLLESLADWAALAVLEARTREKTHEHQLEALSRLAGGIAHDFNNLLLSIVGYTDLAKAEIEPGSIAEQNLDEVLKAARDAARLVNGIFAFSRHEPLRSEYFDLREAVTDAIDLLRAAVPDTTEIELELCEACVSILGDEAQLAQAILQIGLNAQQAIGSDDGTVTVDLSTTAEGMAKLTVRDTGRGMDAQTLERAADPYFKGFESRGSGLGLAIVASVAKAHGGTLALTSVLGEGTEVEILVPITEDVTEAGGGPPTDARGSEIKNVLIIEDEPTLARLTARRLLHLGYEAESETAHEMALERFADDPHRWDLLITDFNLDGMDGIDLVRIARQRGFDGAVIVATGRPDLIARSAMDELDIAAVLAKPYSTDQLARTVRSALAPRSSAEDEGD